MFCYKCGTKLPDDAAFCTECGTKMAASETESTTAVVAVMPEKVKKVKPVKEKKTKAPKAEVITADGKPKKSKKGLIIGLTSLVAVGLCVGAVVILKPFGSAEKVKNNQLEVVYNDNKEEALYVLNGEIVAQSSEFGLSAEYGLKMFDNETFIFARNTVMGAFKDGEISIISEELDNNNQMILFDYAYSTDGNGVAYLDEKQRLQLFRFATGESELITKDEAHTFVLSPDGTTVLYSVLNDGLYIYKNGKSELLKEGDNINAISVSDNGEHSFACDLDEKFELLYFNYEGEEDVIADDARHGYFVINSDKTQISYKDSVTGPLYVFDAVSGDTTKKKYEFTTSNTPIPLSSEIIYGRGFNRVYAVTAMLPNIIYTNLKDFNNCFYTTYKSSATALYYPDGKKLENLAENKLHYMVSDDGSKVIYRDTETLKLYYITLEEGEPARLAEDVAAFGVTEDFERIYYFTEDGDLYTAKTDGSEEEKLDKNVQIENYARLEGDVGYVPVILGNEHIIYAGVDENYYICDIEGNREKVSKELWYAYSISNNTLNSMERSFHGGSTKAGLLFLNRNFVTYEEDGELYIINENGETSVLIEDID